MVLVVAAPQAGVQLAVPSVGVHVGQFQVTLVTPTSSLAVPLRVLSTSVLVLVRRRRWD